MGLLDGGLAALLGAALGRTYLPATLHRVSTERLRGGSTIESVVDLPCRAQIEAASEAMQAGAGAAERRVRILVLASSLAGPIGSGDRLSIGGERYAITAVARDAAGAVYDLAAQRD